MEIKEKCNANDRYARATPPFSVTKQENAFRYTIKRIWS